MGKGVLLELEGGSAVVLTPQGEFKRVRVPSGTCEIGDEISYAEPRQAPVWMRWGMAAAAAAVMLVAAPFGYQAWSLAQPVAVVTVDINPSLELTLNKRDEVLKAHALNADGAALLKGLDVKRQAVDEVVAVVTAKAVEMQKLSVADASSTVVVAVAPAKQDLPKEQADRIRDKARDAATTEVRQQAKAQSVEPKTSVVGLEATAEERKAAEQKGLSIGRWLIIEEIVQAQPDLKVEELQSKGPGKILHDLNINPGTFFKQAEEEHGGKPDDKNKDKVDDKDKNKGKSGSEDQPVPPATTTPDDMNKGKGGENNPPAPKDDKGTQPDDKSKSGSDDKKPSGQGDKPKSTDDKEKGQNDKGKGQHDQDSPGQEKKNGNSSEGRKETWTIPLLGIEVPKPSFLQSKDHSMTEATGATATTSPRANTPGAEATGEAKAEDLKKLDEQKAEDTKKTVEAARKAAEEKAEAEKKAEERRAEERKDEQRKSERSEEKREEEKKR